MTEGGDTRVLWHSATAPGGALEGDDWQTPDGARRRLVDGEWLPATEATMSDRDQLAGIAHERILEYRFSSVTLEVAYAVADAILAVGWRAPEEAPVIDDRGSPRTTAEPHDHQWVEVPTLSARDRSYVCMVCSAEGLRTR